MYYYLNIVILLKFVLLFVVFFIDVYSGCCKDNSKIKTINCEENKKNNSLGLGGGGNDELVQKDASAVNDTIEISEIPIINGHSNDLQAKQISDIKEDYYGDSYKKKPCLSYRDKLDLLYVLKGHEFDQELHSAFIERVVAFLNEGKILRFSKDFKGDYSGGCNWENVIWFFDGSTIQRRLGVECNKCKLLKCFNEKIYYFTLFTDKNVIRPGEEFYNFTDFTEANCDKYITEWKIRKEDRDKFLNLQFDISPEALFK